MTIHEMVLDISCEICPFTTKDEAEMKTHIQTLHRTIKVEVKQEDQNVIKCDQCEYRCKLNIQYKKHLELKHTNEGTYKCKYCEFNTNLGTHTIKA